MSAFPKSTFTKVVLPAQRGDVGYETLSLPVTASTTIKKGDVVKLTSGFLVQAIALPGTNSTFDLSGGSLADLYLAAADYATGASITAADVCPVIPFDDKLKVMMRIYNGTAANSELQDVLVGTAYQLGRWRGASATEWWYAMGTTTTNGDLKLLERSPESEITDDYGLGWWGK